jgi:hypothetical protein
MLLRCQALHNHTVTQLLLLMLVRSYKIKYYISEIMINKKSRMTYLHAIYHIY